LRLRFAVLLLSPLWLLLVFGSAAATLLHLLLLLLLLLLPGCAVEDQWLARGTVMLLLLLLDCLWRCLPLRCL
jgi:hypothetical protein